MLSRLLDHWLTQDALVIAGFALVFFLLRAGAKNERWQRAWMRMKGDLTGLIALGVVIVYLAIGALEILQIPSDVGTRSILDLFTAHDAPGKSYSAPLSSALLDSQLHEHLIRRIHLCTADPGRG